MPHLPPFPSDIMKQRSIFKQASLTVPKLVDGLQLIKQLERERDDLQGMACSLWIDLRIVGDEGLSHFFRHFAMEIIVRLPVMGDLSFQIVPYLRSLKQAP